ncbi:MAG: hypothetical protein LBB48_02420 [Treponema sp.]|jgi:hypothetical protein|nr:hypothetical protein [Treponema sp.]
MLIFLFLTIYYSCGKNNIQNEVEIPFSLENQRIVLYATINGKNGRFYWDTGQDISILMIPVDNLRFIKDTTYTALDYTEKTKIYNLNEIIISGIKLEINSMIMSETSHLKKLSNLEKIDGILGSTIFNGYWCELSFSKNKIILHKEKPDDFTKSIPVKIINKYHYFCVPINVDKTTVYCMVDTGMTDAMRFPESIVRQKQTDAYMNVLSNGRVKQFHLVKMYSFSIFDETFTNKYVMTNSYIAQNGNTRYNNIGIIGIGFLQNYDILFDFTKLQKYKSSALYYKSRISSEEREYGLYSFITNIPTSGILKIHFNDQGIVIDDIVENGIAYQEFGLRPNMIVTKVNGNSIREIPINELYDSKFPGTVTDYTIIENDSERTITRKIKTVL